MPSHPRRWLEGGLERLCIYYQESLVIMMVKHNFGDGLEHSGCLGFRLWVLRVYIFFVYFGC